MSIIDSIASRELRTVSSVRPHPGPSLHIYIGPGRTPPRSILGKSLAEAEEEHAEAAFALPPFWKQSMRDREWVTKYRSRLKTQYWALWRWETTLVTRGDTDDKRNDCHTLWSSETWMADKIPLIATVQLKQTSHEVAATLASYGDLRSSEPTSATLLPEF